MKRKQEKENQLRNMFNYITDNKIMSQNVHWNAKNIKRDETRNYMNQRMKFDLQQEKFLDLRRKKLSERLNKEEAMYHQELINNQESPDDVRRRMEIKLKELREQRLNDRDENVQKLQEKRFYEATDELRKNDSEAFAVECYLEQENQMLDKLKKREKENNVIDNNEENNIDPNQKYADYPEKIVELINLIRADPVKYAETIENSIKNITEEPDKDDPSIQRLIYKKKVKVALIKGEPIFHEAIEYLRRQSPLPPLEVAPEKSIPLPNTEEELNDPTFLKGQVNIIRQNTKIDVFFKDLIKIPEVSGLLMIVDDVNKNAGKKRRALLSKDLKYICVNSTCIYNCL